MNAEGTQASDDCVYSREEIERICTSCFSICTKKKKETNPWLIKQMYWKHQGYGEKWCRKSLQQYPDVEVDFFLLTMQRCRSS